MAISSTKFREELPNLFRELLYTWRVSSKIKSNIRLLRTTINAYIATP